MSTQDNEASRRREKVVSHKVDCYDLDCIHWSRHDRAFRIYHSCGLVRSAGSDYEKAMAALVSHMNVCSGDKTPVDGEPTWSAS